MRFALVIIAALVACLFAAIPAITVRADDTATSQPAAAGSVTVNVVDESGSPVDGVTVKVAAHKQKGEPAPDPVATGKTDSTGAVILSNIPAGKYVITATAKKKGSGKAKLTVGTDPISPITITLKAHKKSEPTSQPATGAPATQPAQ